MKDLWLKLYHRLPYPLKMAAASLQGYSLRRWRYGPETEQMVEEALAREQWSPEQWQVWQSERLGRLLTRAATQVPYYREYWSKQRQQGNRCSWEELANWPVLEKESLREHPRPFVADDCDLRALSMINTSGTSGKPLTLWSSRQSVRQWYALFEARWRRWYGVSRHDRWAIFGGKLVTPAWKRRPPFWVWNTALNQLYMSSYHLAPELIPHYLEALQRYRIKYLWGYTSSLHALAQMALSANHRLPMAVAITNAEPVFDYQRQTISAAFQCPVRETYGMAEKVAGAGECEQGRLHLWPEAGIVEAMTGCEPVVPGITGDLVCTGLINLDMPLIRYRIGDRGTLPVQEIPCACGRTLPSLAGVEGRVDDVLYTADGRCIGRLDPVFKGTLPIREAQIIQESFSLIRVRYVPAKGYKPAYGQKIVAELQARLGPIEVVLEEVAEVPRGPSGKFRAVVCNLKV